MLTTSKSSETVQNRPNGSLLFRNPLQFMVLGREVQKLFDTEGVSTVSLLTIGDANATDAFQLLLGVLLARHPDCPHLTEKNQYRMTIRNLALQLQKQLPTTRYDKNSAPASLLRGEFDVDELVIKRALRDSGLALPFLSVLDVDADRCGECEMPTCFKLSNEIEAALGKLTVGDVLDTLKFETSPTLKVFTVMNMIDTVNRPKLLAELIANQSAAGSIVALGMNEMFADSSGTIFRQTLRERGFTPYYFSQRPRAITS